jgi:hypothetical protein
MATETFDKTIWIDEKAAEIIANELEKPHEPYVPKHDIFKVLKRGEELLQQKISKSKKLSGQIKK